MSNESVRQVPKLAEPYEAPMWDAVLTGDAGPAQLLLHPASPERLEAIYKGAGNILDALEHGLDAMQRLLWEAMDPEGRSNDLPTADDLRDLTHFQNVLGQLFTRLHFMQLNITQAEVARLEKDAKIRAKAGTTIVCEGCEPYTAKSGHAVEAALMFDGMSDEARSAVLHFLETFRGGGRENPPSAGAGGS